MSDTTYTFGPDGRHSDYGGVPCPLCGKRLIDPEIDHMQPVSRGGTRLRSNMWIVCRACNRAKGKRTLYEFLVGKA
jgi:5-methylcytosine-specific restriction endonuclease McrA